MKKGLLLINLGTPATLNLRDVRTYLKNFLSDPLVITLPSILRYFLIYAFILPFRAKHSREMWAKIWRQEGSPLLIHSQELKAKVSDLLKETEVVLAMRYGEPSLNQALEKLSVCDTITVLPLFPQYAPATTGSILRYVQNYAEANEIIEKFRWVPFFYEHPAFIKAKATLIKPFLSSYDFILFSYHGVPLKQLTMVDCKKPCGEPCPSSFPPFCYRAQCFQTSRALGKELGLEEHEYETVFQSRFGKARWTTPDLHEELILLRKKGIKRLLVACPSFVADCLETLEEIAIRSKKTWIELGGEELFLIPCLNDSTLFAKALTEIAESASKPLSPR